MGYWGYEPKDGDGPQDNWYTVQKAAVGVLKKIFNKSVKYNYERWDRIGALQVALEAGMYIPKTILLIAMSDCDKLQEDDEFVESFTNPEAGLLAITEVREVLRILSLHRFAVTGVTLSELDRDTLLPADLIQKLETMSHRPDRRKRPKGWRQSMI